MIINTNELKWTRAPKQYTITEDVNAKMDLSHFG